MNEGASFAHLLYMFMYMYWYIRHFGNQCQLLVYAVTSLPLKNAGCSSALVHVLIPRSVVGKMSIFQGNSEYILKGPISIMVVFLLQHLKLRKSILSIVNIDKNLYAMKKLQ